MKNPLYFIVRKWTKISTAFLVFPRVKQKWLRQEEVKKTHLKAEGNYEREKPEASKKGWFFFFARKKVTGEATETQ